MILCICRGITEREVAQAVQCGARTLDDVARRCDGAGQDCGSCLAYLEHHIQGVSAEQRA